MASLVVVPSKAFDALIYLAARPDRTVSKEELINAVWKDMFVSEDSLVHSMSVLRRALGDDSTNPELIITVPRKGYRLKGPVRAVFEPPSDVPANAVATGCGRARESKCPFSRRFDAQMAMAEASGHLLPVAFVLFLLVRDFVVPRPLPHGGTILFTQSAPEGATLASGGILSPDSRYMVFVARDQEAAQARLYLKQMDSPELRPVAGTEGASHPFWSPASDMIGFFANGELKTVDLRGDIPKAIATVPVSAGGGTWSSSGPILFSDWQTGLYRVDPAGGRVTPSPRSTDRPASLCRICRNSCLMGGTSSSSFAARTRSNRELCRLPGFFSVDPDSCADQFARDLLVPGLPLYVQDDILMAQRFDASRLEVTGKADGGGSERVGTR